MESGHRQSRRLLPTLLLALIALLTANSALAKTCFIGELKLRSQSEVDNFQRSITSGSPCDIIEGELIVEQQPGAGEDFADPIRSLTGLGDIVEIRGLFGIVGNPGLTSLQGMERLRQITPYRFENGFLRQGELIVAHNRTLPGVDGFSNLERVDQLVISNNPALVSVRGLEGLRFSPLLGRWNLVAVENNQSLTSLEGLGVFESDLVFAEIVGNPSLENLAGLERFDAGALVLRSNARLADLSGLNRDFEGQLALDDLPALEHLDSLRGLTAIKTVNLIGNANLRNIDALSEFEQLSSLLLVDNPRLEAVQGLSGLSDESLTSLRIRDMPALTNFDALAGKFHPDAGIISLHRNAALTSVRGLTGVKSSAGVFITDNPMLTNLAGLEDLETVFGFAQPGFTPPDLVIERNASLGDCSALGPVLGYPVVPHDPASDGVIVGEVIQNNAPGASSPNDCLYAYAQTVNPDLPDIREAVAGSWYDPATDGEGLMMFMSPSQTLSLYFYGYDDEGQPDWLVAFSEGPWAWNEPIPFEVFDASGGSFTHFDPDNVVVEPWGTLSLTLRNCLEGELELEGPPGIKELDLQRLGSVQDSPCSDTEPPDTQPPAPTSLTGAWFEPATDGQGFTLHHVNAERGMVYFFGYRDDGSDLWLVGVWEEKFAFGEAGQVELLEFEGGAFSGFDPQDVTGTPWGTLTLRFDDCETAAATLEGRDGSQELALQLLAGAFGLPCTSSEEGFP